MYYALIPTIALVVGTRPNFVKAAPVLRVLLSCADFHPILIHSGQHRDRALSETILQDVGINKPDLLCHTHDHIGWNPDLFAAQLKEYFSNQTPAMVLLFGDVDTTRIAAEIAHDCCIPIAHIEAGLRSFDNRMPEEKNRIRVDQLSDILFATEASAIRNIKNEKLSGEVHLVGNTMIDSLITLRDQIPHSPSSSKPSLVVTLHRRENIENKTTMAFLLRQLRECADQYHIYWPLHPHTKKKLEEYGMMQHLSAFEICEPEGYLSFLSRVRSAKAVITDSGGIQEETTYLGVQCFTLRESTERPITTSEGTNTLLPLATLKKASLLSHIQHAQHSGQFPSLWDGKASNRIVEILHDYLQGLNG